MFFNEKRKFFNSVNIHFFRSFIFTARLILYQYYQYIDN